MSAKRIWTEEKIELLRRLYPYNLTKDIVHHFGCSAKQLAHVAYLHDIRKTPEIRALNGVSGQFKKGRTPFNKGRKRADYMSEEGLRICEKHQFKSGDTPRNTRPMYSERIETDGYVVIKVPGQKKFIHKQRWIWEQRYGPIPENHMVCFKDGNPLNLDISNLELVSKADRARRNCIWSRYPKEVANLLQLKGALNRQINKHKSNQ